MTGSTSIMALLMGGGAHDSKNNNTTNYMSKDAQDDLQKNLLLLSESLKGLSGNNTPATSFGTFLCNLY